MKTLLLKYSRIPKTHTYEVVIQYGTVDETSKEINCPTTLKEMTGVSLETAIEELHIYLNDLPHERVFLMQTPYREKSDRRQMMYELGGTLKDLIKSDLSKAKTAFAPVTEWKGTSHEQSAQPSTSRTR